jgi:hypothetical protein
MEINMRNAEKLKAALYILGMAEVRRFKSLPDIPEPRSEKYLAAREELLSTETEAPRRFLTPKKAIAVILVAALLLAATACAVIKPIRNFFVEVFDEYIRVEPIIPEIPDNSEETENPDASDDDKDHEDNKDTAESIPTTIETVYMITVPEEFMLIEESQTVDLIMNVWMNSDSYMIVYEQTTLIGNDISLDNSNAEYSEIIIENKTVFKYLSNGMYILMWVEHGYLFSLSCSDTVPWETIEGMVKGLAPEEKATP